MLCWQVFSGQHFKLGRMFFFVFRKCKMQLTLVDGTKQALSYLYSPLILGLYFSRLICRHKVIGG